MPLATEELPRGNLLSRLDGKTMVVVPETPCDLPDMPQGITAKLRHDGALVFTYKTAETPAEKVLAAVRNAGIAIKDVKTQEANLEDVFLSLTSGK